MTREECLAMGGHCWQDTGSYYRNAMVGALKQGLDTCKHCPAQRRKIEQPQWRYEEF